MVGALISNQYKDDEDLIINPGVAKVKKNNTDRLGSEDDILGVKNKKFGH